ncbi:MAG: 1-deoxy-D-xylulose-5-phosphate synthase [Phycisphaerales bacterium]|jgi:1-deoxy-D-xylulose-5-phosphate synthase|nr:1-deoxy-D-xylulose-5-phosphate synthase [Phycisphaerales bacterium]
MSYKLLTTIKSPSDLRKIKVEELPELSTEIRNAICEQVKKGGGHLATNLGVVELMIALHYVFDFSNDRLLFDVGHQCYTHKLLTGRQHLLENLRQRGGMSGFPSPDESTYDLFSVGHAGTAISTAVGMARGDTLQNESYHPENNRDGRRVVAFVGDGSIVNGVAMEGLNNAGTLKRQFLVVLNDNNMSIANPQGAIADYFDHLRVGSTYRSMKKAAKSMLGKLPGGSMLEDMSHRMTEMMKDAIFEDSWFEHFGLLSIGPVDGHDLPSLIEMLIEVRDVDRPLILHAHTIKGRGFEYTEQNSTTFHSSKPFEVKNTCVEMQPSGRSFTSCFSDVLCDIMKQDDLVVAATAAMPDGTGIDQVMKLFPNRVWDTGICESHAMDMLAGMAKTGCKPFFAVYSTFLQRAFDQVFQEVSLQGLPVRLCLDRAGVVGGDGAVHHGFCDIALLRVLPNAVLMAAIDEPSFKEAMLFMTNYDDGLSCVRYPRDTITNSDGSCPPFELGKSHKLISSSNTKLAIIGYGTTVIDAIEAANRIDSDSVDVYDARFAKPVDKELIFRLLSNNIPIITVEDHSTIGGFGSAVIEEAAKQNLDSSLITILGLPDRWIGHGSRKEQLSEAGIDSAGITAVATRILNKSKTQSPLVVTK